MSYPFKYIRDHYGVPAEIGRRVTIDGKPGIIVADRGNYIGVTLDSEKPGRISNYHPTDGVEYLGMGKVRKVSKSRERYQRYLSIADIFGSFRDFLAYEKTEREALDKLKALKERAKDAPTGKPMFTALQAAAWSERHNFKGSTSAARVAMEDAATLNPQPSALPTVWHRASEKLPEEADGDICGQIWVYGEYLSSPQLCRAANVVATWKDQHPEHREDFFWTPTHFTKPKPPEV